MNDPVKGWSCQGETDDPRGGVIARYTRHQAKEGQHSGICLARLSEWAGPGQYIGKENYKFWQRAWYFDHNYLIVRNQSRAKKMFEMYSSAFGR